MKNAKKLMLLGVLTLGLMLTVTPAHALTMPAPPGDPTYAWFYYTAGNYITGALLMAGDVLGSLF